VVVATTHRSVGIRKGGDGEDASNGDQRLLLETPEDLTEPVLVVEIPARAPCEPLYRDRERRKAIWTGLLIVVKRRRQRPSGQWSTGVGHVGRRLWLLSTGARLDSGRYVEVVETRAVGGTT
jgi:hypothetical protein